MVDTTNYIGTPPQLRRNGERVFSMTPTLNYTVTKAAQSLQ